MRITGKPTMEEQLSSLGSRLSDVSSLLQMYHSSATSMIAQLQQDIEEIYISMGDGDSLASDKEEMANGTRYI